MRLVACSLLLLCAVARAGEPPGPLLLHYDDFGPQAMAYTLLGFSWWQWEPHGSPDPDARYDVRVVVYDQTPLAQVEARYPVVPARRQDHRHLRREHALRFIDEQLTDDVLDALPSVKETLERTRRRIAGQFGPP